jgi:hypothetical protein
MAKKENKIEAWAEGNDIFFLLPEEDGLHVNLWKVKDAEQVIKD